VIRGGVNIQENANSLEKAVKSNLKKEATPIASFFFALSS